MVEELFPALVSVGGEVDADDGVSFRLFGLLNQLHAGLFGCASAFSDVACGAGTDDVFPGAFSAEHSGHHVVERQLGGGEFFAAVLASAAVSGKDIAAVELDGLAREAVVKQQSDDPRYGDIEMHGGDPIVLVRFKGAFGVGDLPPHVKIVIGECYVVEIGRASWMGRG